jgi:Arc/MetJ family transcription regulator
MRTTLDIDDEILQETINATKAPSKKKAIEKALREYLRMKQRQNLLARIGSWKDFDLSLEELDRLRNEQ